MTNDERMRESRGFVIPHYFILSLDLLVTMGLRFSLVDQNVSP